MARLTPERVTSSAIPVRGRDRPILFSGPMVRALLREAREPGTGKTQTRRVIKGVPMFSPEYDRTWSVNVIPPGGSLPDHWSWWEGPFHGQSLYHKAKLPYAVGDRLDPAAEIPGYPDYCVGMSGNVYSRKSGEWVRLQPAPTSKGYPGITLCVDGRRRSTHTHTLTCEAFHGPRPSRAHQARHISGDRSDGSAANLCWGTQDENWRDRKAHGNGCEGEKHHCAKFTDEEREHIRWGYERGLFSQRHASRTLDVTQSTIGEICRTGRPLAVDQDAPDHSHFRLTLIVEAVRVERLNDISEADAVAEGVRPVRDGGGTFAGREGPGKLVTPWLTAQEAFADIWDTIHGHTAFARSPWVVAITFRPIEANIDALPAELVPHHDTVEAHHGL